MQKRMVFIQKKKVVMKYERGKLLVTFVPKEQIDANRFSEYAKHPLSC